MPKKNVEELPFELTEDLGGNTDVTTERKRREIPFRKNYKGGQVTKKVVSEFFDEIEELYGEKKDEED